MKFREGTVTDSGADRSREELREMAESLTLFRSAMHHVAQRRAREPWIPEHRRLRANRHKGWLGVLLAPALAAAVTAGVLIPLFGHSHGHAVAAGAARSKSGQVLASVNDTVLMNQIDSELSQDVPDALQPLAELSEQASTQNYASEKKNVTQE